ncbi:S8 family serine peptidase [Tritonibacter horizontis]|uniref:Subtilisin E n=1 Tax=Tritonibacter horizontis TaxID=1768241 RepID=A0A132BYR8_9RHOB|nr:S8 family serine peptidase [Tritonibacter horizontis]KUP92880.1 subtilisin E precursor [Tritonibacter horizontis]
MSDTRHCRTQTVRNAPLKTLAAICSGFLLFACAAVDVSTTRPDVASRDVIAILDANAPTNRIKAAAQARDYRLLRTTPLPAFDKVLLTFQTPANVNGQEAIAYLEAAEPAAAVGVNHAYRLQMDAPSPDPRTYAQTLMGWPVESCSARVPVGLVDTVVDQSAPALNGVRVISRVFSEADSGAGRHGTDVASVLAGPGRLDGLTIYNAGVMTRTAGGDLVAGADALIRALEWLASQNVRVVNMSLAGPPNKILRITIDAAANRGMILVASVGNFGPDAGAFYPAAFDQVIAATAVDAEAHIYRRAVRGPFVDVAAPGVDIFVPTDQGGRFVTGTSFAAAFVTAKIAADPRISGAATSADVRTLLASTSEDLGPKGVDRTYGSGLLKGPRDCE